MATITVLGGGGAVGGVAVRLLAAQGGFDRVVVADANAERARAAAGAAGSAGSAGSASVSVRQVDAGDPTALREAIRGSDVVLNCVGPFYRYGPTVLSSVASEGIDYVDVCDDYDATQKLLAMDGELRAGGVTALIGMGSSPGVANIVAGLCAERLFDAVDAVDIYHAHGGETVEGRAVVAHRIHSMAMEVPVFLDGRFQTVRLFDESGRALEETVEFEDVGTYPVYAYPHPETLTLPDHIPGIRRVTNLGLVLPPAYAELIKGLVRLGVTAEEPIAVSDREVAPLEFAISFILSQRDRLVREAGMEGPMGCLKMVVRGTGNGAPLAYEFTMSSDRQGMGEGTGIPAAIGAMLMARGRVAGPGVVPPEAGVRPDDFFAMLAAAMRATGRPLPIRILRTRGDGPPEPVDPAPLLGPA